MATDRLTAEREAIESLMKLFQQAEECQRLHEKAHMTLPEPLKRLIGLYGTNGISANGTRPRVEPIQIPAPDVPIPNGVGRDWVRIQMRHTTPTSVVLAVLRGSNGPMRAKDVVDAVLRLLPTVTAGSISNIGTRLSAKVLSRTEAGWALLEPTLAGIIDGEWLWSPVPLLTKQEMASHRRDAILHVLGYFDTGLQTVQLVEQLSNCSWVQAPVNKDLVKEDVIKLEEEKKIRRRGNTKKWELVRE